MARATNRWVTLLGFGLFVVCAALARTAPAGPDTGPVARWTFEEPGESAEHGATIHGKPKHGSGVSGQCLVLDGTADHVRVPDAEWLHFPDATFSVTAWVNPYRLNHGQQMIVAKNVYSANWREWGLMLDKDNTFRFYFWNKGWKKLASKTKPTPGMWYHLAVTMENGLGRFYVNGAMKTESQLGKTLTHTPAPLTIGAVCDGKRVRQTFAGAIDNVYIFRRALDPKEIDTMADGETTPHHPPKPPEPVALWDGESMPESTDIPVLDGIAFHTIQPLQPEIDGYRWLHGVSLAWHRGNLFASYGRNKGKENSAGEVADARMSPDGGKTWSPVFRIAESGDEPDGAVSHGVLLSRGGELWAFQGAFHGVRKDVHTRAWMLDEATNDWIDKGTLIEDGFWPLQDPVKMDDGNWIMAGIRCEGGYNDPANHAAVAISKGDNLMQWDLVVIPNEAPGNMWAESNVIVDGARVTSIARYQQHPVALVAESEDFGRTWTPSKPSNMPMAKSKPCAGMLSTGQRYLVCTTTGDTRGSRSPLTIALSRPGERLFSRVFVIRRSVLPGHPDKSGDPEARLSYPCATEHEGCLYVGYSNACGRGGNRNNAELAVIPLSTLKEQ